MLSRQIADVVVRLREPGQYGSEGTSENQLLWPSGGSRALGSGPAKPSLEGKLS